MPKNTILIFKMKNVIRNFPKLLFKFFLIYGIILEKEKDKMSIYCKIFLVFLLAMSIITFILYGIDKRKAIKNKWRIKEITLLGFSLFGGAIGGIIGMTVFHHKTKHWYFWAVNIIGIILHALLIYFIY